MAPFEILHYVNDAGRDLFLDWQIGIRDPVAQAAIDRRLNRMALGNFGDHAPCREGVWELRIHVGAGYRVYYAMAGRAVVLLLAGGDKRSQSADVTRACECWKDAQRRLNDGK